VVAPSFEDKVMAQQASLNTDIPAWFAPQISSPGIWERFLDWFKPRTLSVLRHSLDRLDYLDERFTELQVQRAAALEQLHLSESKYKALSEAGTEAIVIHRDFQIYVVNDTFETLIGYTEGDLVENSDKMWDFIKPEFHEIVKTRVRNQDCSDHRMKLVARDGTEVEVDVRIRYVEYNGHGACRAMIMTPWRERHA
jgi:PAS domain S-box-containing protein